MSHTVRLDGPLSEAVYTTPDVSIEFQFDSGVAQVYLTQAKEHLHTHQGCIAVLCDLPAIPSIVTLLQDLRLHLHHSCLHGVLDYSDGRFQRKIYHEVRFFLSHSQVQSIWGPPPLPNVHMFPFQLNLSRIKYLWWLG